MRRTPRQNVTYAALLACAFAAAILLSWLFGTSVDNAAYDWMLRRHQPVRWEPHSAILAIDEATFRKYGGIANIRAALSDGLELIAAAKPRAVAIDVILADTVPQLDPRLEQVFARTPNLVLDCLRLDDNNWEFPLPRFRRKAVAIGHVYVKPDPADQVSREIPLEREAAGERYWALSLAAFRVAMGARIPTDARVHEQVGIPSSDPERLEMRIRYTTDPPIPRLSINELVDHPELASRFTGKTVFVGDTSSTSADRKMTPLGELPGVEIHAQAFETIAHGAFLREANWMPLLFAALLAIAAGVTFAYVPGWQANVIAGLILLAGAVMPYVFFTRNIVFSFITPFSAAWLCVVTAAAYEHLVVRRALRRAEAERVRYQQSLHFVTHEMRTPLTAIQGSSELITRYSNMPAEKRKQMALLINSESKRLARMIEMFLNVERLSAGQMELKKENFEVGDLMSTCVERVRPLAERKQIHIHLERPEGEHMAGDRELMEYAFYNLLTNAVKYSPQQTEVTTNATRQNGHIRISVQDQGIGMDQKEVRKIFQKFYRTKKAEESGEVGTGIGLSIVEQIVTQHGGTIEVKSRPGEGSRFTLVLPVPAAGEK
jgi:signal transduction histidine kinase